MKAGTSKGQSFSHAKTNHVIDLIGEKTVLDAFGVFRILTLLINV
jgi:hypothetical protein